ncbi:MAG: chromosomal replication initiator protein DnaA [Bacillota bacterium]
MLTANEVWESVLQVLEKEVQSWCYDAWFQNLKPKSIEGNALVLSAPTDMSIRIIKENYYATLKKALKSLDIFVFELEIVSSKDGATISGKTQETEEDELEEEEEGFQFNPKYTFETFVVGDSNIFTHAAARVVAENPGQKYNPLFIYGGVGLGKTHIMHAIGNYIKVQNPKLKLVYTTSEKFTNDLITAIRSSKDVNHNEKFREKYRNVDVLMIDDIQFIENKPSTQQELFHTFNELYNDKKQIILTSDRMPKQIPNLEERLRTRFEWGMIADVQPPSLETKVAILQMKAAVEKYIVPNDVLYDIASRVESNIREMESLLSRVIFFATLRNSNITMALANEALKDYAKPTKPAEISPEMIMDVVSRLFEIPKDQLIGKKKTKDIVMARQIAIYVINELLGLPLMAIGGLFGGRDHTTIMHARDKITAQIKTDKELAIKVSDVIDMVHGK